MNRPWLSFFVRAALLSTCLLLAAAGGAETQAPGRVPVFELDPSWPAPLADPDAPWPDLDRNATSVAVDPRDHVWMMQLPTPEELEAENAGGPRVFEFDPAGNVIRSWGGPGTSDIWMQEPDPEVPYPSGTPAEHGMFVDHDNNVWVTGNGHVALKFSPAGELLLQVGELGRTNGSNDTALLGNSCELTVDPARNELYVADGYNNRRVIVFDAATGDYSRHWGGVRQPPGRFRADGQRPVLGRLPALRGGRAAAAAVPRRALRARGAGRHRLRLRPPAQPGAGIPARRHVRQRVPRGPGHAGRAGVSPGSGCRQLRLGVDHRLLARRRAAPPLRRRQHERHDLDLPAERPRAARVDRHRLGREPLPVRRLGRQHLQQRAAEVRLQGRSVVVRSYQFRVTP